MKTISNRSIRLFSITFLSIITMTMGQTSLTKIDLSIFPKPEQGFKQMVIEVPHSDNDANKKIEFVIGKWMEVDSCNKHGLMGTLEEKNLEGWGYGYFVFDTEGHVMSTEMACLDKEMVRKFISAQSKTVRYNGRLPIVIYVPKDCDVQFKIFQTEGDVYQASEVKPQ
ncbi:proteinase inhibitor [Flagellimonas olearia]|uniref:Proteinase inhibitor n=1 Tax=Flagellimonas olearia TaxID=552546 RepID=A0A6I1E1D2_9FLAO|nr:ecotin family protein [Allomuricauda olearia]KAB7530229.1 proteinase inhibitor [Allomuricauda olearia]